MQIAAEKIIRLLSDEQPSDVRCAAVTILGELGGRDGAVTTAVTAAISDEDDDVRLRAIQAAGRLRIEKSLPRLAERIKEGGAEAEAAAEAMAGMGAKGTKALRDMLPRLVPGLRRYIAASLARAGVAGSGEELDILADKDASTIDAAVSALTAAIPKLDEKKRSRLAEALIKLGTGRKKRLSPQGEAGVMRLAGLLDDARIAPLLWERVLPPNSAEARATALQALGKWVTSPGKDERERLFQCAAESDFRIVAPALMLLDRLPASDKNTAGWTALLRAPDIAARRVAMNKVGDLDHKEVVEALLEQVRHPDRGYRQEVFQHLGHTSRGRKGLGKVLREAVSSDEAWELARVLLPFAKAKPKEWMEELFPAAADFLESANQRANPLLYVLRESDNAELRDRLEKRATALVKKGKYETADLLYRTLTRDPAVGFPIRLAAATCGLKTSPKELEEAIRATDPSLHHFGELAAQDQAAVLTHLGKTSWLTADELYYLGFHFAESTGALRKFGGEVLKLLLKKHGRTKLAQAAKNKLKTIK
jgi:hypothetical protein